MKTLHGAAVASCIALVTACTGVPSSTSTLTNRPVAPIGTILAAHYASVDSATDVYEGETKITGRDDPDASHGWSRFGYAVPRGDPTCCNGSVYAVDEAWLRTPAGVVVVRAQAHPASRRAVGDFKGSAWSLRAQDSTGTWSAVFARGSANPGNELDDQAAGAVAVPQLMTVGEANPEMFACAGGRSADGAVRTTVLLEVKPPVASPSSSGSVVFAQDLLNGDDRFVPNAPGPLRGPATPPTPTITHRPGNPVTQGHVDCAMNQAGDDVTTRELHMLTVVNGHLLHSVASNFSTATDGAGFTLQRFNTISPWGDVSQALNTNFGTIVSAAIVASRPTAISVLFAAQAGDGRFRLYHTVRFSDGAWRPADDVFILNGATLNGLTYRFDVAAGMCPVVGQPQTSELVYVVYDVGTVIEVGRVVATSQQWPNGTQGIYSPLDSIGNLWSGITETANAWNIHNVRVGSRPFR